MEEVKKDPRPIASGYINAPDAKRSTLSGKAFVFTAAQNNTYVHKEFLESLETFCEYNKAELIVSPFTYNKNGFQNSTKDDSLWYDPAITKYLMEDDVFVSTWKDLVFCGELNILPTAVNPFSGLQTYCRGASGIIPHTKVRMESLPRMKGEQPRFLYSTGAVTKRNYIKKKAGQKAEFHHTFGALYVTVNEETGVWHARQLIASNDGSFQDLDRFYFKSTVITDNRVESINWGDIHAEKEDEEIAAISWDSEKSILDTLKPKYQFVHDLTDFTARNHHNIDNPYFLAEKYFNGGDSVKDDISASGYTLYEMHRDFCQTVVVDSNHDQALKRWLQTGYKHIVKDPENIQVFHELNAVMFNAIENGDTNFNIHAYAILKYSYDWIKEELRDITFLQEDESFIICQESGGIECSLHGHRGINGARGTPAALNKIGRKVNSGHTHSAGIIDGVYTAGVSAKLDMDYNKGPSSWSHSHIVTYPNGKRAIITIKNGEWR